MIQTELHSTPILKTGFPKTHLVGNIHPSLLKEEFHQQYFLFVTVNSHIQAHCFLLHVTIVT